MRTLIRLVSVALAVSVSGLTVTASEGASSHRVILRPLARASVTYVAGSTHEVCALTGHGETQTASGYGLKAADHGYPFYFQGKLWFLFGDAQPTKTFPPPPTRHGQPNQNRWSHDKTSLVNDAIGYASSTSGNGCSQLAFARQSTPAVGAYRNPSVTYGGRSISLRTNESPNAGISLPVNGKSKKSKMYVLFSTNNPTATHTPTTCKNKPAGCLGYPYSSVMAVLTNPSTMSFAGLYTFSGPPPGPPPYAAPGKFVNVAIASALSGGYLYFWGTTGSSQPCPHGRTECYRHSYVYLARMKAGNVAQSSKSGRPKAIEYFQKSKFVRNASESVATPVFRDSPPCAGELGVAWNRFMQRWVMLYNCRNNTPGHPFGIYMRTATQPWGPWSGPQTIFNPTRDHGYCHFIDSPTCKGQYHGKTGGDYGPYFIPGTTGGTFGVGGPVRSIFYYTLDTFHPYGEVIMTTTISR